MNNWNYRIVFFEDGRYALRRVHYNYLGEACAMDGDEVTAIGEAERPPEADVVRLERAIVDARTRPVFVVTMKWAPADTALAPVLH